MAKAKPKTVVEKSEDVKPDTKAKAKLTPKQEPEKEAVKDGLINISKVTCDDGRLGYEIEIKGAGVYTISDDQVGFKGIRVGDFETATKKKVTNKVLIDSIPHPK